MSITKILVAGGLMFGIALIFSIAIVYISEKFYVKPDLRAVKIREMLSGANCGACGFPGCDGYAKALVNKRANVNMCPFVKGATKDSINLVLKSEDEI